MRLLFGSSVTAAFLVAASARAGSVPPNAFATYAVFGGLAVRRWRGRAARAARCRPLARRAWLAALVGTLLAAATARAGSVQYVYTTDSGAAIGGSFVVSDAVFAAGAITTADIQRFSFRGPTFLFTPATAAIAAPGPLPVSPLTGAFVGTSDKYLSLTSFDHPSGVPFTMFLQTTAPSSLPESQRADQQDSFDFFESLGHWDVRPLPEPAGWMTGALGGGALALGARWRRRRDGTNQARVCGSP